ncbi:MAG: flagellar biosynthesis protein FlhB [Anaerolineae bacterium]|nr:flagellar biosynthesis protein FlhB [Anaerolineae bacterium]MDW8099690.1 flagellar biosynthesis protein FlhB [Anaerolineae bacterium]
MSERTEAPTPRRLAEIRRRGQVAKSVELSSALSLLVGVYMLRSQGDELINGLGQLMREAFGVLVRPDLSLAALQARGNALALFAMGLIGPLVIVMMVTGVLSTLAQTRGLVALTLLKPNLNRINPMANLRILVSRHSLMEVLKDLGRLAVIGLVVFVPLPQRLAEIAAASTAGISNGMALLAKTGYEMVLRVALLFGGIAVIDYVYQRRRFQRSIRMTREEVKEEMRSAEGSPHLKGRIRQMQRRLARLRMMQQVPKADVVITNPTHLAVALQYNGRTMLAPTVVAKGKGVIAAQIVRVAQQHRVPIVENPPLAHALIRLEVGTQIPPALYQAVAEVLAFVYRLRQTRPIYV